MGSSNEPIHRSFGPARKHIAQLDGVRGLAILLVTIYRFGRDLPESTSGAILPQVIGAGTHGVELFFVLSGFLITGILFDSRGSVHQLRNFFARRSLRILPLYFFSLTLCLWLLPLVASSLGATSIEQAFAPARDQQLYLWFYLTNIHMSLADAWCFGPLDHFWSLAVEEHFYLLWPLAVVFLRSRILLFTTLALTLACVASRTGWLALGGSATAAEVLTIWRCDGLLMGALLAVLIRTQPTAWQRVACVARWAWAPLLVMALVIDFSDRRMWMAHAALWNSFWFCVLANVLNSPADGWLSGLFTHRWLRGLGKLSYGMYVFQSPLIPVMAAFGWSVGVSLPLNLLYVGSMFALTVGIAWCSWHGFEKHWLRLKDYFPQYDSPPVPRTEQSGLAGVWAQPTPGA